MRMKYRTLTACALALLVAGCGKPEADTSSDPIIGPEPEEPKPDEQRQELALFILDADAGVLRL